MTYGARQSADRWAAVKGGGGLGFAATGPMRDGIGQSPREIRRLRSRGDVSSRAEACIPIRAGDDHASWSHWGRLDKGNQYRITTLRRRQARPALGAK